MVVTPLLSQSALKDGGDYHDRPTRNYETVRHNLFAWICISSLQDLLCYGFIKVFKSRLLTETYRGSAQARPKQALHDTSYFDILRMRIDHDVIVVALFVRATPSCCGLL